MKSKIEKLVVLVNPDIELKNLLRLVDGDLAHIGDAIIAGKEIKMDGDCVPLSEIYFRGSGSHGLYTIKQETRSLNGYEYPAPETEAPRDGVWYYVPAGAATSLRSGHIWCGDGVDRKCLKARVVHLAAENAIAHAKAIFKAGGGEI